MKKIMAALAALLLLTACGADKTPAEPAPVPETPVVEEQPVEIVPEILPEAPEAFVYTTKTMEGLVEDTVAYIYEYPEFDHAEINRFYTDLMASLVDYARQNVYTAAVERHTIADVTGSFTMLQAEETVTVTYTVAVEFADGESESFDRTDTFDRTSGQPMAE